VVQVRISAKKQSFQASRKQSIAVAATLGATIGNTMRVKMVCVRAIGQRNLFQQGPYCLKVQLHHPDEQREIEADVDQYDARTSLPC